MIERQAVVVAVHSIAELREQIAGIADVRVRPVADLLTRHLWDEDDLSLDRVVQTAGELLSFAAVRTPGQALVKVGERVGSASSVLMVATDDMPFLVDSVSIGIAASGRTVDLVLHPTLEVRRDASGALMQIRPADASASPEPEFLAESWMWIEMDREFSEAADQALCTAIAQVLADVRNAVGDWPVMQSRLLEIADDIAAAPPVGIPAQEAEETVAYLRWLADDNFTFLGYREYDLKSVDGEDVLVPVDGTGKGILRATPTPDAPTVMSKSFAVLPAAVRALARRPELLVLSKANSRSTVHRRVYLDYVGVKRFDAEGAVTGERRFLGLYSSSAYTQSVLGIPILRSKAHLLERQLAVTQGSHDQKDLIAFLETYPRDELFQTRDADLLTVAESVLHLQERRRTQLYLRADDYGRFMSCMVYLPRDRYTTAVRLRIERLLADALGGTSVEFTARVTESVLARLHFVVHVPPGQGLPAVDPRELEARVASAARSWEDEFAAELTARMGDAVAAPLLRTYGRAFPESYKDGFAPERGVVDAQRIQELAPGELSLEVYQPSDAGQHEIRLKITRIGPSISLSTVLPILASMGLDVVDEYPYEISRALQEPAWILDFGMRLPEGEIAGRSTLGERLDEAFVAIWDDRASIDGFNALIVTGGMGWRDVLVLRAYARYMRQIGSPFSQSLIEEVVTANHLVARMLVNLFRARFAPTLDGDRSAGEREIVAAIEEALDEVASLDQDRILRSFLALIRATLRTNFFQSGPDGLERASIAVKLDPQQVPDMPLPRPKFEIWVFTPRVEGAHLRFGPVARGGLRWSDRQEDFRTEILGLVKAQEVKNAVIVPVGAKGGFYAKRLPDPSVDRDAWLAEGKAAYREFICSLLDVTDNLVDGVVVPPVDVVRHDADDTYLVVAADKGTATFSDIANGIAAEYGFWLGDAFASGGSMGYDHKAMGITARGAWESVKRHFSELDLDTQAEDFTVVGIGDMSGDVFGNGMLLSEHIRLVVAFDHRHVFVDPDPDAATSFAERRRLFDLPRSSWADYDPKLISAGGGVFARTLKSITVTPEMSDALGIAAAVETVTPDELIQAALKAPVDLLWNGGIGTYVKAQTETSLDVGDKSNDRIRINGHDLRCRVVGEGGNLGFTQLGRIEAARHGVRLNTDAIDNSAGVDTSDHEVNIKILLDAAIQSGSLDLEARNVLLAEMTDDVARMVLADNYGQNVVLGNSRAGASALVTVQQRMIRELERTGMLDRALEFLPDDEELRTREAAGEGLTGPELCVLLAYAKIWLTKELNESTFAQDAYFTRALVEYFPHVLHERFAEEIAAHPLRAQIISTVTVNRLINIAGITFVFRAMEETGASAVEVVRAATAAMEVFRIPEFWQQVNENDGRLSTNAQVVLHLETRRLLDRATRWFLQTRGGVIDVQAEVTRFASVVDDHTSAVPSNLQGRERERFDRLMRRFEQAGAPEDLARYAAGSLDVFALLDIADICVRTGEPVDVVIPLYFTICDRYDIDETLVKISDLPRSDRWSALARFALRSDLYSVVAGLTSRVLRSTSSDVPPLERLSAWEWDHSEGVSRARTTLDDIEAVDEPNLATLSVALRSLRNLVAQEG